MKDLYKIHEIAKLFGLHPDTLRYYEEKGLLHPERGENGYRMYTIQDICTLNIIRAQRELGVPVEEIGAYLERRTVEVTLDFLDEEEALLRRKMAELEAARAEASERRSRLLRYGGAATGDKQNHRGAALCFPAGRRDPGAGDRLFAQEAGEAPPGLHQDHWKADYGRDPGR